MATTPFHEEKFSAEQRELLRRRLHAVVDDNRRIPARPTTEAAPLSPVQHGQWVVEQLLSDNSLYNVYRQMWLHGPLDVDALTRALDELVRRHEILRTTYRQESEPVQVINEAGRAGFELVDLYGQADATSMGDRREHAIEIACKRLRRTFDLGAGPVLQATLIRVDADEHLLVLTMHHIVSDGWSCRVIGRELGECYSAVRRGERPELPALPIQYADYAYWHAGRVAGQLGERELGYWKEALAGVAAILQLPTDRGYPPEPSYRSRRISRLLSVEQTTVLRDLAARRGVTLFTAMLSIFAIVLSRCAAQDTFAIGSLVSGRGEPDVENLVGQFANTVAVPADLSGDPTFDEILSRTQRSVLGALDNQDIPFEHVVAAVGPMRDPVRNPVFQVLFQFVEHGEEDWSFDGIDVDMLDLHNDLGKTELSLFAVDQGDRIELQIEYATDLFEPGTAARYADRLVTVLDQVTGDPAVRLSAVDVISPAEYELVLGTSDRSVRRRAYVLDGDMRSVPLGTSGELWIGGFESMDTDADAVPDPFDQSGRTHLRRTGYRARLRHDGELECLGLVSRELDIDGYRFNLHEIEARLRTHPGVLDAAVVPFTDDRGRVRLVGHLIAEQPDTTGDVRDFLARWLPNSLIPVAWTHIAEIPRTSTGAVDYASLPTHTDSAEIGVGYLAPRSRTEQVLSDLWAEEFGLPRFGVRDDFFELGGDSVLAIKLVARAKNAGMTVSVRQLLASRTIEGLAALVGGGQASSAEAPALSLELPLTPILRWFVEQPVRHDRYSQAVLLGCRPGMDPAVLAGALGAVREHHEALRLRLSAGEREWVGRIAPTEERSALRIVDLAKVPAPRREAVRRRVAQETAAGVSLADGPVFDSVLFTGEDADALLLVGHRVAIDAASWRILVEDLDQACAQIENGEVVRFASAGSSFRRWAERVGGGEHATSAGHLDAGGQNTIESSRTIDLELSSETTEALHRVSTLGHVDVEAVLLTALAQTVADSDAGIPSAVDVTRDDRERGGADVDISRAVGWFSTPMVMSLRLPESAGWSARLEWVKQQLQRDIDQSDERGIANGSSPVISFRHVGERDAGPIVTDRLVALGDLTYPALEPTDRRLVSIEVETRVCDGRLVIRWSYSADAHGEAVIRELADGHVRNLAELIDHCGSAAPYRPRSADFPLAHLDDRALERLFDLLREKSGVRPEQVEDIYPLSALQSSMVFGALYNENSEDYIEQIGFVLRGSFDPDSFVAAWERVARRHAALRTHYTWQGLTTPLQVVLRDGSIRFNRLDWTDRDRAEIPGLLSEVIEQQRVAGFDLSATCPSRFVLARNGEQETYFLWTFHHILLDAWSMALVLDEVFALYNAARSGASPDLPEPAAYRDYIDWLDRRDQHSDRRYWAGALAGFSWPTLLVEPLADGQGESDQFGIGHVRLELSRALSDEVRQLARRCGSTVGIVLQTAWALLIGRYTGTDDVLFGTVMTGRTAEVPGIERMVGLIVNTVPTRVAIPPDLSVTAFVADRQRAQLESHGHEHSSLAEMRRHTDVPANVPLFDSIFNYDTYVGEDRQLDGLRREPFDELVERTDCPLMVEVDHQDVIAVAATYHRRGLDDDRCLQLLGDYQDLVRSMVDHPDQLAATLCALATDESERSRATDGSAADPHEPDPENAEPDQRQTIERRLAQVWQQVLGLSEIHALDNFFELGGDSFSAIGVVSSAAEMGMTLTVRAVMDNPTIQGLATAVQFDAFGGAGSSPKPTSPERSNPADPPLGPELLDRLGHGRDSSEPADVYPLTPLQAGMLIESLSATDADPYFLQWVFELDGPLDADLFGRAWRYVVDRHPGLRTYFVWEELAEPVQVVRRTTPISIERWEGRSGSAEERTAWLRRLVRQERERGIELDDVPPLRLILVRVDERRHYLIWNTHHLLIDGWSRELILSEVRTVYEALAAAGAAPELPSVVPMRSFVDHLLACDDLGARSYWAERFRGAAGLTPLPGAHRVEPTGEMGLINHALSWASVSAIRESARRYGVAVGTLTQAAWALVLATHSGVDDVTFGVTVSGRSVGVRGIDRIVGMLINTVPERVVIDRARPIGAWLLDLQRERAAREPHEHHALSDVARWAGMPGGRTMFATRFVFNGYPATPPAGQETVTITEITELTGEVEYPLVLAVYLGDEPTAQLRFDQGCYDHAVAAELVADYAATLDLLANATPGATLAAQRPDRSPHENTPVRSADAPTTDRSDGVDRPGRRETIPAQEVRRRLAEIWADVLRVDTVGIDDDFYALGGDSVLVFRVVAQARQAGLPVTVRQALRYRTIRELAAVSTERPGQAPPSARANAATSDIPLTPTLARFSQQNIDHNHHNQSRLLSWHQLPDPALLAGALRAVIAHHDALRFRLGSDGGAWRLRTAASEPGDCLRVLDLAGATEADHDNALNDVAKDLNAAIDLAGGPIVQAALLLGSSTARLLLVAHHLAVDTVSWSIMLGDLDTAYRQLAAGQPVDLPRVGTSYRSWAGELAEYANTAEFGEEATYWLASWPVAPDLPLDRPRGANKQATESCFEAVLSEEATQALLDEGAQAFGCAIEEVLTAAVAYALSRWTGSDAVTFDVERHGREPIFDDVDLSRTMGWFATIHPQHLRLVAAGGPARRARVVREQLHAVPDNGIGYGLARYLAPDLASALADQPRPQVLLMHHGQRGAGPDRYPMFDVTSDVPGTLRGPDNERPYLIVVDTAVVAGRATVAWTFSTALHDRPTIERVAGLCVDELEALAGLCQARVETKAGNGAYRGVREHLLERLFPSAPVLIRALGRHRTPGAGIAVIADGRVASAWGEGTTGGEWSHPVDASTAFQACSVSKYVTALAVLRLVQEGRLDLDTDVTRYLERWRPLDIDDGGRAVTLRGLLSHTAGLSVFRHPGYRRGSTIPTLDQVLDGVPPANTPKVRRVRPPGPECLYSCGNYSVVQQVVAQATGLAFEDAVTTLVLLPLGMADSHYDQDPPGPARKARAHGHLWDGTPYSGGWRVFPELASSGLWTTAGDLAQVSVEIHRAIAGEKTVFLERETAREMVKPVGNGYGLGVASTGDADTHWFGHPGDKHAYQCFSALDLHSGAGLVVMANIGGEAPVIGDLLNELSIYPRYVIN
jgi:non-ribosomal peptide synthase protein (TIGR01720 family)